MKQYTKKCSMCGKSVQWDHGSKPDICPHCGAIAWDKPDSECKLFNLQRSYLKTHDKKILGEMYKVLYPYTKRILLKMLKSHSYDENTLEDRIEDTVTYFIGYYLRKDYFYVTDSFGKLLILGAQQQLYNKKRKNIDMLEFSYDKTIADGETTILDELKAEKLPIDSEKDVLTDDLMNFIDKMFKVMVKNIGLKRAYLALTLLYFYVGKIRVNFDNFYSVFGTQLKNDLENEKFSVYEYVSDLKNYNYN